VVLGRASTLLRAVKQQADTPAAPPAPASPPPIPAPAPAAPRAVAEKVTAPPPEKVTAPAPEVARAPVSEKVSAPPPGPASSPPPMESPTSSMAVEHLLMEGEVRMTVSDYANAIKVYARLVDLVPNNAIYRAKLAIAMAFHPPSAKQAEREFLEATRLEPNNPDLHYQFALYYKAMKVKSRAITELETAVRLNPRHRLARTELEAMAPKDSALTNLKKLFR
jgi:tetratricopeptide (TPR) repeat protein